MVKKSKNKKPTKKSEDSRKGLIKNNLFPPLLLLVMLSVASFLLFKNLGNQYLWQDEAQTALIAKTVLSRGIPLGYDGKNFFSQELGAEYGRNYIYKWHTWFSFYLLAGFFGLFGINTYIARLPFALFGLATIAFLYFYCRSLWADKRAGVIAVILLISSVPFLILSRQCRYYSPTAFFVLLSLYSYSNLFQAKRYFPIILIFSCLLLFHVNHIYYGVLILTIILHSVIFHRDQIKKLLILSLLTLLINLPWIIWTEGILSENVYGAKMLNIWRAIEDSLNYLYQILKYIFPWPMILISFLVLIIYWIKRKKIFDPPILENLILLLLFIGTSLSILSPLMPTPFFRYLTPLIPIFSLILSLFVVAWMKIHAAAAIAIILVFVSTQPILNYLYEITHDYNGPIEGIVKYLNQNGKKDEVVAITYGDLPLKFYTDMRVVGGLTGENLSPAKEADWIIIRKHVICEKDWMVRNYLIQNVSWHQYERITINYPDIPFENRESPQEHNFRTVTNEDRVVIYRKIR